MSSIINDLRNEIDKYEADNVETKIVDFQPLQGSVVNKGEEFRFRVRVRNQSHLDMRNVRIRIDGTQYASIKTGFPWVPYLPYGYSKTFNLDAHQIYTTNIFYGKALKVTGGSKQIVTARIYKWDASLCHLLIDHTGAGPKEGILSVNIQAD